MKKDENRPCKIDSLTDAHQAFGLPKPQHPLVSLVNGSNTPVELVRFPQYHILGFYHVAYKPKLSGKLKYGQHYYDFGEGGLLFTSPGQVIGSNNNDASVCSEYNLFIHPDFFLSYPLAKIIKQYGFFSYSTNEALHLLEDEKITIIAIFKLIEKELNSRIDDFSHDVIIAQIGLFMNYVNRFYKRQFIIRKAVSNELLQTLDDLLNSYFNDETSLSQGLPTVGYLAEQVGLSPSRAFL